jgi:lipoate-protein ligase B
VDYSEAYRLQKRILKDHISGTGKNTLILLQHNPVITIGTGGKESNILIPEARLSALDIKAHKIERGGDVTYHGPGQLTGYPIIDLRHFKKDLYWYLRQLEEVIIKVLSEYDISGKRVEGYTGVWVGDEKIAAIGIAVRRWITYHGFALNVNPDMSHFDMIIPCGIADKKVTSIEKLTNQRMDVETVADKLTSAFAEIFKVNIKPLELADYLLSSSYPFL